MENNNSNSKQRLEKLARVGKFAAIFAVLLMAAAALHPPRYANASQQSQDATLAECLRYLRTQIFMYSLDHHGVPPGFPGNDITQPADSDTFVAQMTQFTDATGRYSLQKTSERSRGPYLMAVPANPITLQTGIMIVNGNTTPRADDSKPCGWIYNPITKQISPNVVGADSQGVSYASY